MTEKKMSQRTLLLLSTTLFCFVSSSAYCQSLSANSGINSADTYVIADLTVTNNSTFTLPIPAYNPVTQTSSSTLQAGAVTQTFHVEAGYDTSGGLVMNFWPTSGQVDTINSDGNALGFIRFAGGQMTAFDQTGAPLQIPSFPRYPLELAA